jgi:hypothetical protein
MIGCRKQRRDRLKEDGKKLPGVNLDELIMCERSDLMAFFDLHGLTWKQKQIAREVRRRAFNAVRLQSTK